jgi:hypothetical protein
MKKERNKEERRKIIKINKRKENMWRKMKEKETQEEND